MPAAVRQHPPRQPRQSEQQRAPSPAPATPRCPPAAAQSGEKQFDWESKITMKWGLNDLGAVLATLQGRQEQAKLFHQSEKANSAFELTSRDDPQKAPFFMSMSRQEGTTKNVKKVTIPVTHAEAAILETALRAAITRLIGW
jgi:hypothetical protein